jgi:hypothetical protein
VALSPHVFGRWLFSHEEDGARVYRPRDGRFAPSRRPRDGFDISADGAFRTYTPGPADAPVRSEERWTLTAPHRIAVGGPDGAVTQTLQIVAAAPGLLKVRRDEG